MDVNIEYESQFKKFEQESIAYGQYLKMKNKLKNKANSKEKTMQSKVKVIE